MAHAGKIVLLSNSGYHPERDDAFLQRLLDDRIALFCVLGVDAEQWEDALDGLFLANDEVDGYVIITTSHQQESLDQVIAFARHFNTGTVHAIEVHHR